MFSNNQFKSASDIADARYNFFRKVFLVSLVIVLVPTLALGTFWVAKQMSKEPKTICVASHTDSRPMTTFMYINKMMIPMTTFISVTTCDKEAPNPKYTGQ
jgi:uncharacterized membrane protein YjgN (DUF898 family)